MITTGDVVDFEGLLKIAHNNLHRPSDLKYIITQLAKQTDNIVQLYTVNDSELISILIQGVTLLRNRMREANGETDDDISLRMIVTKLKELNG